MSDIVVAFEARRVGWCPWRWRRGSKGRRASKWSGGACGSPRTWEKGGAAAEAGAVFPLPAGAPERILEVRAEPVVTETAAEEGGVRVQGHLNYGILYSHAGSSRVYFAEWSRGAAFALEAAVPRRSGARRATSTSGPGTPESRVVTTAMAKLAQRADTA